MAVTYSVYDRRTDMPVIIGGTARECAAAIGLTIGSFHTIRSKQKNGQKTSERWEIHQDEEYVENEDLEGD